MPPREIIDGAMTTRRAARWRGALLAAPGVLALLALVVAPLLVLVAHAFAGRDDYGAIQWTVTAEPLLTALGRDQLGALTPDPSDDWSADHLRILGSSLAVAAITTVCCLALGFPLALWIARRPRRRQPLWLALVLIPSLVNLVIRVAGWNLLLGPEQAPAEALRALGLLEEHGRLVPSQGAVLLAMVSCMLPFTVLPLYAALERLDWSLVEAARDCYAGWWRTVRHGILSQAGGGIAAAVVLTFVPTLGMVLVTDRLGGAKTEMIGNLIARQFKAVDFPLGAALSLVLIVATLAGLAVVARIMRREQGGPR